LKIEVDPNQSEHLQGWIGDVIRAVFFISM